MEDSNENSDSSDDDQKLEDKLFESENDEVLNLEEGKAAPELSMMDAELMKKVIESDSPELLGLLQEFKESLETANTKLLPLIEKVRSKQLESTAAGISYLEMKYNLLMSYCTFLAFYLLLKVEGRKVEGHPVIYKLAHIKTLFEKLRPLDSKLQYQVDKMLRLSEENAAKGGKNALKFKPNLGDLQMN